MQTLVQKGEAGVYGLEIAGQMDEILSLSYRVCGGTHLAKSSPT